MYGISFMFPNMQMLPFLCTFIAYALDDAGIVIVVVVV